MRPHREPYLQRARERHLRRARATHARTGKGPVPRARAPRQGWWRAACPVGRDESEAAGQKRAEWIRAYSPARLSLCMWGSRRSTCAGTRERNAAGCGSAAQRQCSGGRKDISDATSARHGWRGAHAESRSSRRAVWTRCRRQVLALGVHCPVTIRLALNKTLRRCNDAADIISYSQVCPHNYTPRPCTNDFLRNHNEQEQLNIIKHIYFGLDCILTLAN